MTNTISLILCSALFFAAAHGQLKDPNQESMLHNDTRFLNSALQCSCSPSTRGFSKATYDFLLKGVDEAQNAAASVNIFEPEEVASLLKSTFVSSMNACFLRDGAEACINADQELRKKARFYCMYDSKTGKNVYYDKNSTMLVTVASCASSNKTRSSDEKLAMKRPMNQGCVAIQHIKGHRMQYRRHLKRQVLCSTEDGFCATPDHAILFDDKWTSLKRLCKKSLNCTKELRLVNNLKVLYRSQVRFNERIVITAFDARFPKFVIYVAQIAQDVTNFILKAIAILICTIIAVAVHAALQDEEEHVANGHSEDDEVFQSPRSFKEFKEIAQNIVHKARASLSPRVTVQAPVGTDIKSSGSSDIRKSTEEKEDTTEPEIESSSSGTGNVAQAKEEKGVIEHSDKSIVKDPADHETIIISKSSTDEEKKKLEEENLSDTSAKIEEVYREASSFETRE